MTTTATSYGERYAAPGSRRALLLDYMDRYTGPPLLMLSVVFTVSVIVGFVPNLSENWLTTLDIIQWSTWAVFALDLMVKVSVAQKRIRYLADNWAMVLIVLLPFLRPLVLLRGFVAAIVAIRQGQRVAQRRGIDLALALTIVVIAACAVGMYVVEGQDPEANILSLGDAIWWAMATVTTVGYGDTYPVTTAGRGIGVLLMMTGITLFGFITASLAAFFVDTDRQAQVDKDVHEMLVRMKEMEERERHLIELLERNTEHPITESPQGSGPA
jgi:voltage-gated potassium channel